MKTMHAGLIAALSAILFFSGCAQQPGGGGGAKPNVLKITLPERADHAVTLDIIVGEFQSVKSAGKIRTLSIADRQFVTLPFKVVIPAGQRSVEIPVRLASGLAPGREFIVGVFEEKGKGNAPMVGVTTLRIGNQGQLVSKGGIHIGPRPK